MCVTGPDIVGMSAVNIGSCVAGITVSQYLSNNSIIIAEIDVILDFVITFYYGCKAIKLFSNMYIKYAVDVCPIQVRYTQIYK